MTDIKMSEVFGSGVTSKSGEEVGKGCFDWDCGVLRKIDGGHVAEFDEVTESAAAAHAINHHDKLVAENEKLRELLAEAVADTEPESPRYWHKEAKEALNRP